MAQQGAIDNQRGLKNQRCSGAVPLLDVAAAAKALGVKRTTIYAYAARGMLRSFATEDSKEHVYAKDDVERLLARKRARAGHAAVAQDALYFGAPVLDSAITEVRADGIAYRGHPLRELLQKGCGFEAVAELLWSGALGEPPPWPRRTPAIMGSACAPTLVPAQRMIHFLSRIAMSDHTRMGEPAGASIALARELIPLLASCFVPDLDPARMQRAHNEKTVALIALRALGRPRDRRAAALVDAALVICADHELPTSTFGARVAASSGADLYNCLIAALATGSGPRHLTEPDRFEALVRSIARAKDARRSIETRIRLGEDVAGFGHRLYPQGDPRTSEMLAAVSAYGADTRELSVVMACIDAMREMDREPPNLDAALVAVSAALRLPPKNASGLFALGRTAGWVAHILEQRASNYLLRPRARFIG